MALRPLDGTLLLWEIGKGSPHRESAEVSVWGAGLLQEDVLSLRGPACLLLCRGHLKVLDVSKREEEAVRVFHLLWEGEGPAAHGETLTELRREGEMIYVFCPKNSTGARDLATAVGGKRIKVPLPFKGDDVVVMWGACLIGIPDEVKVLNNVPPLNKISELTRLLHNGVPVPPFSTEKPLEGGWLARVKNHQGGKDLLSGRKVGDFYVKKLPLVKEFRVHVWKGQSIRLGMKVPRREKIHPWIRSYDGGWKLSYGKDAQEGLVKGVREAAKKAVKALGLDFGAVDVGVTEDGTVYVLEVNRRPGLEGNTTKAYALHLKEVAA